MKLTAGSKTKQVSVTLAISLAALCLAPPADCATFPVLEEHHKYCNDLLSGMKWLNGQAFIDTMCDAANALDDYVVDTFMTGQMKDALKEGGGKFYFKKKHRVRLEVTKGTISQGSTIVRREDGVVEGRGGGMLKFMKMTLQEDSRMLTMPSGKSVVKTTLPGLFAEIRARIKNGTAKARVSSDPVVGKLWKGPVKVIEVVEGPVENVTDRIFINPATNIPIEWDQYREGVLRSMTYLENFKSNVGLDDKLFAL